MERLRQLLRRIHGKSYKAYKQIEGSYNGDGFTLHIDHAQSDPFAAPSRLRAVIPQAARLEREWFETAWRRTALEHFLTQEMAAAIRTQGRGASGSGKSGLIFVDTPGPEMLPRTSVNVDEQRVELRFSVGLPAAGRTILGEQAEQLLCRLIPVMIKTAVFRFNKDALLAYLRLADQQQAIRRYLRENGYVAFVANGSVLPRQSGASSRPLTGAGVIPFQSPPSLEVAIPVPHREPIRGMAIPAGITLIVGGGYHGKSTLLKAVERGVYNHVPGDGREYVITDEDAVKIRAEDGRRVEKVNISPFISNLPFGRDTTRFSTDDASGSTSQAANIMEALEMGATTLLLDEDTSATNFMIRDVRMQKLVAKEKEPITPFVDKIRLLYEEHGVSVILVMGGSGDYFSAADTVIMMDEYVPRDVTSEAKSIARQYGGERRSEGGDRFGAPVPRVPLPESFDAPLGKKEKADAKGLTAIVFGSEPIDLSGAEQLVHPSQTRAIALMMKMLAKRYVDGHTTLSEAIDSLYGLIAQKGLDVISPYYGQHPGDLALPRRLELAAAVNRLRTLKMKR